MARIPERPTGPILEGDVQRAVRERLASLPGVRVFRNNVGVLTDERGNRVAYGLGVGSADLIGSVTVDTAHGPLAVSLAVEVKRPGAKPSEHQARWLADKEAAGWIVGVATSPDEAQAIVERGLRRLAGRWVEAVRGEPEAI